MEKIAFVFDILLQNWQTAVWGVIIVSCAVIFIMGILKKLMLGKIRNKLLRKVVLAFSSVVMTFPVTALFFVSNNLPFSWYLYGCALATCATILTYWLYENTGLRNAIAFIGEKTVGKWFSVLCVAFLDKASNEETKDQLTMTTAELREEVKKDIKKQVKDDYQLKGL